MEDIYDENTTDDYVDGVVGGVVLGKFLIENSDSTYKDGYYEDGTRIDNTESWGKLAPPKKGISGCIATLVGINSFLIAVASIILLIYLGFKNGFNF